MGLGLRGELKVARVALDRRNRFHELALQLEVYDHRGSTGERVGAPGSPWRVFGGVWDVWRGEYTGDEPANVHVIACSARQRDFVLDTSKRISGKGGRGGGKSEALAIKSICKSLMMPGYPGQVVAPIVDQARTVWRRILNKIPRRWLRPGLEGIRRADRELAWLHGVVVRFRSSHDPDALRSYDCAWIALDEEKDITDEAIDVTLGSLRVGPAHEQQLFGCGTPEQGEYEERWRRLEQQAADPHCAITVGLHSFPSLDNPFVPAESWEAMRAQMDERRYRQEILAEFVPREDGPPLVFPDYDPAKHGVRWPMPDVEDVTAEIVHRRMNLSGVAYIIGCDPNYDAPNYAVVWKVFRRKTHDRPRMTHRGADLQVRSVDLWVTWAIVQAKGHSGILAREIKAAGYGNSVTIIDATAKRPKAKMRAEGLRVHHNPRNPLQTDSITDVLALMCPMEGEPRIRVRLPECQELSDAIEVVHWDKAGKRIDKGTGWSDDIVDAWRYPISYFAPAGRIKAAAHGYSLK